MVKKLFRHECFALGRVLVFVQGILLAVALSTRVIQFFEFDHFVYDIIFGFAVVVLVLANMVNLVAPLVMGVVRYYKNLFTAEGYLSFTLPVTPAQHILVKLLASLVFGLLAVFTSLISVAIATAGDVFVEIVWAARYLLRELHTVTTGHIVLYVIEWTVLFTVTFVSQLLFYYGCISIGQLSRKNRILTAVGVYFAHYAIMQVLGTIFTIVLGLIGEHVDYVPTAQETLALIHVVSCGSIVWVLTLGAAYFLISHTIIRKRLNLE